MRAHALEAGAFVLSACGQISEADIPDDFPHKGRMNIGYAKGGSSIIAPLGIPLVEPVEGPAIVRAELQAWMIKAWKAIIDTNGHYARPDLLKLTVANHVPSQHPVILRTQPRPALLAEAAERNDVEPALVESMMHDVARLNVVGGRDGSSA